MRVVDETVDLEVDDVELAALAELWGIERLASCGGPFGEIAVEVQRVRRRRRRVVRRGASLGQAGFAEALGDNR